MSSVTRARTAPDHVDLTGGHLGGEPAAGEPLVQQQRIDGGGGACDQAGADLPFVDGGRHDDQARMMRRPRSVRMARRKP
jgi:hypothetical protein